MANQPGGSAVGNTSNKRKRGLGDQEGGPAKVQNTISNGDHDPNNYGLLLQGDGILPDDNTRTAQAALAAPGMNPSAYPEPGSNQGDASLSFAFDDGSPTLASMSTAQALAGAGGNANNINNQGNKPTVGSAEWHQLRKDNHKEVERRRREVINEGIENIAKIVPATEKNKGAILQRTYEYIQELLNEKTKWQDERATFDIAIKELTSRLDRMKESARTAWAETTKWQSRCRDAGLHFEDYDDGGLPSLEGEDVGANLDS
ncbi:basic helix-loop-helix protein [Cladophialophora chaetospira]|uniref:Basic helix-loop-helix protein n=1 Tax=Cladophialophora chaetospira TaxID=386627 RepID=A0AA38WYF1_9EURO|nr:basic helix-loop-helix protein [Cladophialophora chaetospira]